MADRVIVAVLPETLTMLERVRNKQDGADPEPCYKDAETPCAFCGELVQYVTEMAGPEWICRDCWAEGDDDGVE